MHSVSCPCLRWLLLAGVGDYDAPALDTAKGASSFNMATGDSVVEKTVKHAMSVPVCACACVRLCYVDWILCVSVSCFFVITIGCCFIFSFPVLVFLAECRLQRLFFCLKSLHIRLYTGARSLCEGDAAPPQKDAGRVEGKVLACQVKVCGH